MAITLAEPPLPAGPVAVGEVEAGQVRLEVVTPESIASAVETLADADTNAAYRRAILDLKLPTWKQFAGDIENWIESVLLDRNESDGRRTERERAGCRA